MAQASVSCPTLLRNIFSNINKIWGSNKLNVFDGVFPYERSEKQDTYLLWPNDRVGYTVASVIHDFMINLHDCTFSISSDLPSISVSLHYAASIRELNYSATDTAAYTLGLCTWPGNLQ